MRFKPLVLPCVVSFILSGCASINPWSYYNTYKDQINYSSPRLVNYRGFYFESPEGFYKKDSLNDGKFIYFNDEKTCQIAFNFGRSPYNEQRYSFTVFNSLINDISKYQGSDFSDYQKISYNDLDGYRLDWLVDNDRQYYKGVHLILFGASTDLVDIDIISSDFINNVGCFNYGFRAVNNLMYLGVVN